MRKIFRTLKSDDLYAHANEGVTSFRALSSRGGRFYMLKGTRGCELALRSLRPFRGGKKLLEYFISRDRNRSYFWRHGRQSLVRWKQLTRDNARFCNNLARTKQQGNRVNLEISI